MANIKNKKHRHILFLLSCLYILIGFSYIIYYISYTIRITNKLEGWAYMLFNAFLCFIAYVTINHILIRRIIPNKILVTIEVLLFVAILTLIISDAMYESYLHLKYLQRTTTIAITH